MMTTLAVVKKYKTTVQGKKWRKGIDILCDMNEITCLQTFLQLEQLADRYLYFLYPVATHGHTTILFSNPKR